MDLKREGKKVSVIQKEEWAVPNKKLVKLNRLRDTIEIQSLACHNKYNMLMTEDEHEVEEEDMLERCQVLNNYGKINEEMKRNYKTKVATESNTTNEIEELEADIFEACSEINEEDKINHERKRNFAKKTIKMNEK